MTISLYIYSEWRATVRVAPSMGSWYDSSVIVFYLPGGIPVYAFSVLIALGAVVGLAWVTQQAPQKSVMGRLDGGLWALLGGILGGRAVFTLVNWQYFQSHPLEILQVYLGGLAWPGALAGGLLVLGLYAWLKRLPFADLADGLAPLLATLVVSAWLGCCLDGCAYGPATGGWLSLPGRDEWGRMQPRLPVQLLGAGLSVALFWLVDHYVGQNIDRPGIVASLDVLGLAALMFGLSFLRADPIPLWRGLRLDAWAALGLMGIALIALLWVFGNRIRHWG